MDFVMSGAAKAPNEFRSVPGIADNEMPMSCEFCSRFCAVTTISSRAPEELDVTWAWAVNAAAAKTAATATARRLAPVILLDMASPSIFLFRLKAAAKLKRQAAWPCGIACARLDGRID